MHYPLAFQFYSAEYSPLRRAKLILFSTILAKNQQFTEMRYSDKNAILGDLEGGCINDTIYKAKKAREQISWDNEEFVGLYHSACYRVAVNLDVESDIGSSHLISSILSGNIEPIDVGGMKSCDLCPEKYENIQDKRERIRNAGIQPKTTSLYRCGNCGNKSCTYINVQTRSLDEESTIFVNCPNCGRTWKG